MTVACERCGDTWARDPALEVACAKCGRGVGQRCVRPSGHGCAIHAERDLLAMERGFVRPCSALARAVAPPGTAAAARRCDDPGQMALGF